MPKVTASNGIRPEYRALSVIKLNEPVTPSQINIQVGTGDYAAKYISFLRKDGFEFSTQKDGRQVVSYTLVKEPANVERFRSAATPKPSVVTPPVPKNRSNLGVSSKRETNRPARKVDGFGNTPRGEVASFAIDPGFDAGPTSLRDLGLGL